jgi:hypothetical protein
MRAGEGTSKAFNSNNLPRALSRFANALLKYGVQLKLGLGA